MIEAVIHDGIGNEPRNRQLALHGTSSEPMVWQKTRRGSVRLRPIGRPRHQRTLHPLTQRSGFDQPRRILLAAPVTTA